MAKRRRFRSEDQEREYWATHDSVGRVGWSKAKRVTPPRLRPSVRTISLRLPESMLDALKLLANRKDVPYQSLIKVFLSERIRRELGKKAAWLSLRAAAAFGRTLRTAVRFGLLRPRPTRSIPTRTERGRRASLPKLS